MKWFLLAGSLWLGVVSSGQAQTSPPSFQISSNALVLPAPIAFKPGTAELASGSELALQHIKAYLEAKSYISLLRIEGHVAEGGSNQLLSTSRAKAVVAWLVAHGVDCQRLLPVGFGNTKPVAESSPTNTRIEAVNAALRGHAIGGQPADGGGQVAGDPCKP